MVLFSPHAHAGWLLQRRPTPNHVSGICRCHGSGFCETQRSASSQRPDGLGYPFSGWTYQPDYLEPPNAFHIGDNSEILEEPLCFYAPFFGTPGDCQGTQEFSTIKNVKVSVPRNVLSETLLSLKAVGGLQIETGDDHVLRLTLDGAGDRQSMDFRPDLPLIIIW